MLTSEYSEGVSVQDPGTGFMDSASEAQTSIEEEDPTLRGRRITFENTLSTLKWRGWGNHVGLTIGWCVYIEREGGGGGGIEEDEVDEEVKEE